MAANREEQILHSWEAKEYPHYRKNFAWYFTFIAVLILMVAFQIFNKDIFGAVCLAILGAITIFLASLPPKTIQIVVTPKGLHMADLFVPYSKMRHFWVVDNEKHKTLNIETTAFFQKMLVLELNDQNPDHVRSILTERLMEIEESEPTLSQKFMDLFKF